jgi:two-component system, LytTR family, sensor kinase
MIANLGQFLRITLRKTPSQEVILEREIEFLRLYLEIEQVRFQDRLMIEFDIASETLYARVPNLILQPIVENAIKHAVAQLTSSAYIKVVVSKVDEKLILQVTDNGPGITDIERFWSEQKIGIGLSNTRARLEYLYGSDQKLEMQNSINGGLIVRISIPFQIHTDSTLEVYSIDE